MSLSPIILFVYNRPDHTKRTLDALGKNILAAESPLFIFSDGPKDKDEYNSVERVREVISGAKGFKEVKIVQKEKNLGLADSVISGVNEIISTFGKVIVMEDDIITSRYFLNFMNETLQFYKDDSKVYSISGYNFPVKIVKSYPHKIYISPRPSSWGWATWRDRWEKVDWNISDYRSFINNKEQVRYFNLGGDDLSLMLDRQMSGKINSWAIRWAYSHFISRSFCLYPVNSFLINIGADKSGTHTRKTSIYDVDLQKEPYSDYLIRDIEPDERVLREFRKYFSKKNILKRIYRLVR